MSSVRECRFSIKDLFSSRREDTRCLEDFNSLSIRELRDAGALPPSPWQRTEISSQVTIQTFDDPTQLTVEFRHGSEIVKHEVGVTTTIHGKSLHYLFVCPQTDATVRCLYFVDGTLGSRYAYDIPYATQVESNSGRLINRCKAICAEVKGEWGPPPRGKRLHRLIAFMDEASPDWLPDWESVRTEALIRDALEESIRRDRAELRRRDRSPTDTDTDTDAAIERCERGGGYVSPSLIHAHLRDGFEALVDEYRDALLRRASSGAQRLPLGVLEDHPTIDIRALHRRGKLQDGELTAWAMRWAPDPSALVVYAAADMRSDTMAFLRLAWSDGAPRRQVIGLWPPATDGRWSFRDPASGERCHVLALRGSCFGSRQSQHLVNRSQIGANRARAKPKPGVLAPRRRTKRRKVAREATLNDEKGG